MAATTTWRGRSRAPTASTPRPGPTPNSDVPRTNSQRDALFGLAVLDGGGDVPDIIARARDRFGRVRLLLAQAGLAGNGLDLAAERGEAAARQRLVVAPAAGTSPAEPPAAG